MRIEFVGGPRNGAHAEFEREPSRSLLVTGEGIAEGQVARYRRTRQPGVYRFDGIDTVVAQLPEVGKTEER